MSRLSLWRMCRTFLGLGVVLSSAAIARAEGGASGQGLESAGGLLQTASEPGKADRRAPATGATAAPTACATPPTACHPLRPARPPPPPPCAPRTTRRPP